MPAAAPSNSTTRPVVIVDSNGAIPVPDVERAEANTGAASAITATLAASVGLTTYINGFAVDGLGATAGSVIEVTVTGVLGGTLRYKMTIPAGATVAVTRLFAEFERPIPASAVNTAIVVNVPSFGAGNTSAIVNAHGFSK